MSPGIPDCCELFAALYLYNYFPANQPISRDHIGLHHPEKDWAVISLQKITDTINARIRVAELELEVCVPGDSTQLERTRASNTGPWVV